MGWVELMGWVEPRLVAGDGWVDGAGPGVDASGEGSDAFEALIAEPHGYAERTRSVMTKDYYGGVGVEFLVGPGGYFAHGHQERVGEAGGLELPRLADVQQERGVGLLTLLGKGLDGDFGFQHDSIVGHRGTGRRNRPGLRVFGYASSGYGSWITGLGLSVLG
jgi:hypothetical protein